MKKPPPFLGQRATLIDPTAEAHRPADRPDDTTRAYREFSPVHNWIEVERVACDTTSTGGIDLSATAGVTSWEARVRAVGPGLRTLNGEVAPCSCRVGDYVVVSNAQSVWYDGYTHWLVRDSDVVAIVEPPKSTSSQALAS